MVCPKSMHFVQHFQKSQTWSPLLIPYLSIGQGSFNMVLWVQPYLERSWNQGSQTWLALQPHVPDHNAWRESRVQPHITEATTVGLMQAHSPTSSLPQGFPSALRHDAGCEWKMLLWATDAPLDYNSKLRPRKCLHRIWRILLPLVLDFLLCPLKLRGPTKNLQDQALNKDEEKKRKKKILCADTLTESALPPVL